MQFKASLDTPAVIITTCTTVLFAAIIITQYTVDQGTVMPSVISLLLAGAYMICFLYRPVYYSTDAEKLVIHRTFDKVTLSRKEIYGVELLEKEKLKGAIRTFGVGGLFGYFGRFTSFQIGNMTWYVTRRDRPVLITTSGGKKIVLSPDEPEKFVAALGE